MSSPVDDDDDDDLPDADPDDEDLPEPVGDQEEDLEDDSEEEAAEEDITPVSVVDVDPIFEKRVRDLQQQAADIAPELTTGGQTLWFRPGGWEADVFDYDALTPPFDTSVSDEGFIRAHQDPQNPGTTGDIITATTQIDYMDCMERAMRARHLYPLPRCVALMAGRKVGHGAPNGLFAETATNYVRRLSSQAKG